MRIHLLGLSHSQTTREFSADAFTQKARLLGKMLIGMGHEVIAYGVEGSELVCSEFVPVLPYETWAADHKAYDWRAAGFKLDQTLKSWRDFTANAIREIGARKRPGDFLFATFGLDHKPIADAHPDIITVESGIGYEHTFAQFRVFESYAWMHFLLGREGRCYDPPWYNVVIPNYLDLDSDDYPFHAKKGDYAIHIGRAIETKGRQIAVDACKEVGVPLYVAGQGHPDSPDYVNLGVLSIEERARWVGLAKALIVPTYYVEPFGTVAIEALAYGTPVITTDWGGFTETVQHGVTGFRCRTMDHFEWALRNIEKISPGRCREAAEANYSLGKVGTMYQEFMDMLAVLYEPDSKGWYKHNPDRAGLGWLRKL